MFFLYSLVHSIGISWFRENVRWSKADRDWYITTFIIRPDFCMKTIRSWKNCIRESYSTAHALAETISLHVISSCQLSIIYMKKSDQRNTVNDRTFHSSYFLLQIYAGMVVSINPIVRHCSFVLLLSMLMHRTSMLPKKNKFIFGFQSALLHFVLSL